MIRTQAARRAARCPQAARRPQCEKKTAGIIYQVPSDTHAEPLLILLHLDSLSNRREDHFVKLINTFVSGKCQAMNSFVTLLPDNSLDRF